MCGQPINLGTPPIRNHPRKMYGAGSQNWDAAQDQRGMIYWANNDGVLRFDGTEWRLFPVSNRTIVRSVAMADDGRLYAGAQGEMGYFSPDRQGILRYTSLVGLLPETERSFEDVWDICFDDANVFFRTNKAVYQYTGDTLLLHHTGEELHGLFSGPTGLLLQSGWTDLRIWRDGNFRSIATLGELDSPVTGVLDWAGDTVLLTTLKQGIYYLTGNKAGHWKTRADNLLADKRIYSATALPESYIAIGTSLDGVIIMDRYRQVFRHINKQDGLQNNNTLHIYYDGAGSLWLGLDNGIDCIHLNSPISHIFPDGDLRGTGYAAALVGGRLYLGVSNGVYSAPWAPWLNPADKPHFHPVAGSDGQVWRLQEVDQALWMGHHEGAFRIQPSGVERISPDPGNWTFVPLNAGYLMAGTYAGLTLYKRNGSQWTYDGPIRGLTESCRIMVRDANGYVWISHPYRGIYRVHWQENNKFNPEIRFFDQSSGLPTYLNNYVFQVAGRVYVGTEKGVYVFDPERERFAPDSAFQDLLGKGRRINYLREDLPGNVWYVAGKEVGRLRIDDSGLRKQVRKETFPILEGRLVGGFEMVYPIDANNVLFGTEEGFILMADPLFPEPDSQLQLAITGVRLRGKLDSLVFGGYPGYAESPVLSAHMNTLSFSYSATEYMTPSLVRYRTWLEGQDSEWSAWTAEAERHISNLPPGKYIFRVQAQRDGLLSDIAEYPFRIRPPWYSTPVAWFLYSLGIIGVFAGVVSRQRSRFESEKAQMTESHQQKEAERLREVEASKAALTEIQNEKLEVEIKYKNQELAMTTMHLVQKAEMLLTVQQALNEIQAKSKNPEIKKDIRHLLNLINFDVNLDADWEHFAHHFDQVHVDFLKNLREQFPQLSSNDYKLCAYLRMNLSTKEIAPLMNISVRGVEGSRYRLRRKLNLPAEANLTDFILNLPPTIPHTSYSSPPSTPESDLALQSGPSTLPNPVDNGGELDPPTRD